MVYYAVDANGQSIGYIVYLGQDGKVSKIEAQFKKKAQ